MTKRSFKKAIWDAMFVLFMLLFVGICISITDTSDKRLVYSTFKDFIPLFLGIIATWLGYIVQRRSAYMQQLRTLWSTLVEAVRCAEQYTSLNPPSQDQYFDVLSKLSIAIEEMRGVFCNLGETNTDHGLYPFEPLKDIRVLIAGLGYGANYNFSSSASCRTQIEILWKAMRSEILKEFDREEPTFSHSHWADMAKARVYDDHGIPKTPS